MTEILSAKPVILVVEDEAIIRLGLAADAEDAGFTVLEAATADQAITILQTRTDIRLIVTDIDMPGSMDGLKLAAYVRDRWPPVQLIVVSGHVTPTPGELPKGGRFFAKPYRSREIIGAIRAMTA